MKKGHSGSPSKKPRSSSSVKFSSFSPGRSLKERIRRKKAASFTKPPHDPGEKNRSEGFYQGGSEPVSSSGGGGCCSGITGLISLFAILAAVVLIVFLVKCL